MLRTWLATLYESESEQTPKPEKSFLSLTVSADSLLSMRSATRGVPLSSFSTRSSNTRIALKGLSITVNKAAAYVMASGIYPRISSSLSILYLSKEPKREIDDL